MAARLSDPAAHFWSQVQRGAPDECWPWTGGTLVRGYGQTSIRRVRWYVHRLAWTLTNGDIPDGLTVDHLCRNRLCCNVAHLELVTGSENARRMVQSVYVEREVQCRNGHRWDDSDPAYFTPRGFRQCRPCRRAADERYRERKRAETAAVTGR